MALTARATVGFEFKHNRLGFPANPVPYEGSTGTTYTKGRLVSIANPSSIGTGLLTALTSTVTASFAISIVGAVAETKVTTKTDRMVKVFDNPFNVYTVSFDGHVDAAASKTSTAQNEFNINLSTTASTQVANYLKGALIHIYEGPGKGDTRTVHTCTTAAATNVVVIGEFSADPTTNSKCILLAKLSTEAGKRIDSKGTNIGSRGLKLSTNAAKVSVATAPGSTYYLNVVGADPANLTLDVMIAPAKHALVGGLTV